MYNDLAFAPFGEAYATSGSTGVKDISFAGNNEDTTTNLYDAYFREYGIQGRWPSPDPAGIAAANPANPQSWNRYAYVMNDSVLFIDSFGLDPAEPCTVGPFTFDCPTTTVTVWGSANVFSGGGAAGGFGTPECPACTGLLYGGGGLRGRGPGSGNGPGGPSSPQTPSCTALKKMIGQLGQTLDNTSNTLNLIAIAGGVATFVGGLGEAPSGGLDTPATITAGTFTAAAETGSLITGAAGALFDSFANGNTSALRNFNTSSLTGLAVTLTSSKLPFLKRYGQTIGDLAQQALSLTQQAQGGCQ